MVLDFLSEAPTPAVKKAVKAGLAEFEKHKKTLLGQLSRSRSFDQEKCWLRLNRLAQIYFLWQAMPHAAKREADLRKLAETLGRASRLAEKVRQDNVGSELVSHLIEGILPREPRGRMVLGEDGSLRADFYPETDFKQMVGRLKDYQAAVRRTVLDVPTRLTGPSPSLSKSFIRMLRDEYEQSTGQRAGRGVGPFLRFVMQFRAALDPTYQTTDESGDERVDRSMIDAIQDALRKPRTTARRLTK